MTSDEKRKNAEIAERYFKDCGREGGVVLIYNSCAYGWKNEVRDACAEKPGAIAIDREGNQWQAEGGDDYNGAEKWVPLANQPKCLLPCPFCGSTDVREGEFMFSDDDGEHAGVECLKCDASNRLEHWNTRP